MYKEVDKKMKNIATIKGQPVIEIYESYDGSYWYVTERVWKQDSLIGGQVYKNDQILYGYVKLSCCPECEEFGYFSEAELVRLGWKIWKVEKRNWSTCPDIEMKSLRDQLDQVTAESCGAGAPVPSRARQGEEGTGR